MQYFKKLCTSQRTIKAIYSAKVVTWLNACAQNLCALGNLRGSQFSMLLTFENFYDRGRPNYQNIWPPTWSPKAYIASILKIGKNDTGKFCLAKWTSTKTRVATACPYLPACSADSDSVLHTMGAILITWSVCCVFAKQLSVNTAMGEYDTAFGDKLLALSHPCVRIYWFSRTLLQGLRHRDINSSPQID